MASKNTFLCFILALHIFGNFKLNIIETLPIESYADNFGIILDAGSSSTKIRIYSWTYGPENVPAFIEEFYKKFSPGISDLDVHSKEIEIYLREIISIIEQELDIIPERWATIPIYFMATAGMRLLDEDTTGAIMTSVNQVLSDVDINPFMFEEGNARILSGEEEALFAWLTVNYFNNYFASTSSLDDSLGLVEIGGGSAQIAFIPEDPIYAGKMPATIAGREYGVYCHSFLSFGATLIAERIAEHLIRENPHAHTINNPCMLKGDERNGTLNDKIISMVGGGNASLCESVLRHFLSPADPDMCSPKPCTIGQVYQPPVKDRKFFTFGLTYYLAKDFATITGDDSLTWQGLRESAIEYCGKNYSDVVDTLGISPKFASRNCQDGLYVPMLLSALGIDYDNVIVGKQIQGQSVKSWSVGAMLYEEERLRYLVFSGNQV
ncbi:Golgi apyrase [Mactra antiquata]